MRQCPFCNDVITVSSNFPRHWTDCPANDRQEAVTQA